MKTPWRAEEKRRLLLGIAQLHIAISVVGSAQEGEDQRLRRSLQLCKALHDLGFARAGWVAATLIVLPDRRVAAIRNLPHVNETLVYFHIKPDELSHVPLSIPGMKSPLC